MVTGSGSFAVTWRHRVDLGKLRQLFPADFERQFPDIRRAIAATLRLLEQYEVPATWAVLGHLYLRECRRDVSGRAHPELIHPAQSWFDREWLSSDPCTNRDTDPLWYGDDIVDALRAGGPNRRSAVTPSRMRSSTTPR